VLNVVLPIRPEEIETQTVSLEIDLAKKTSPELGPLRRVDEAFEDRILDALAVILATFRYPAEAPPTLEGFRVYIVGHDDQSQRFTSGGRVGNS